MIDVKNIDKAISPKYFTSNSNDPILLHQGQVEIENNQIKIWLSGYVEFVWLRSPQIRFSFKDIKPTGTADIKADTVSLYLPNCMHPVNIRLLGFHQITDEQGYRCEYSGKVEEPICFGNSSNISYVILHLANFHDTLGNPIRTEFERQTKTWKGRFSLNVENWKITIDKVENFKHLYKSLKDLGGYGITHTIRIEKSDGSLFNIEEIDNLKEELFYFLSFVRGFWTEPFFEVGFDENGNQIWEKLSPPRTDKWQTVSLWFDYLHPESLSEFWISFHKQLQNPVWAEILKRAIRWYIAANQKAGEIEGSIILAQTAHEMLSWTKFVSEKGLSVDGYKNLHASEKLRNVLSEAKIPLDIPDTLKFLPALSKSKNWVDGAQAVTEIRNKLVHPSPKNIQALQNVNDDEMQDAYILTMWYLELTLLFLLGYKDRYANRLIYQKWAGQTEPVPWI